MGNTYKILACKPKEKSLPGKIRRKREDNIKKEGVNVCVHLGSNRPMGTLFLPLSRPDDGGNNSLQKSR